MIAVVECKSFIVPVSIMVDTDLACYPKKLIMTKYNPALPVASIGKEEVQIIDFHGHQLAITLIDGKPYAFQSLCPHEKASFSDGRIEGYEILCPRHFARFDLTSGSVSAGWRVDDLKLYPTRISGDVVEVDLDAVEANPPDGEKTIWDLSQ